MTPGRALAAALLAMSTIGCHGSNPDYGDAWQTPVVGGDARRGQVVITNAGCGSCHTIPGITGANGLVGPPLLWFSRRTYIAGELPNTPENLVHWVQTPTLVEPATAMPTIGLSEQQARDVAAFLYTLR